MLLVLTTLLGQVTLHAADEVTIDQVRIGLNGYYKVGMVAPMQFQVTAAGDYQQLTPQIRVVDPDGHAVITTLSTLDVGSEPKLISTDFRSGKLEGPVQINILDGERIVGSKFTYVATKSEIHPLKQDAQLWIVDGEQPAFESAALKFFNDVSGGISVVKLSEAITSFTDPLVYEAVDLIVLNAESSITPAFAKMLDKWVARGGRLVISIGEDAESLSGSSLADWLPCLPTGTVSIHSLTAFNQLIPGSEPIRFLRALVGAKFEEKPGKVLVRGLETPLLIRAAHGLGTVTLLSVRLDHKPLSSWDSQAEFAMLLADLKLDDSRRENKQSVNAELSPTGVTDLQTQLVHALDEYESINRPSYWVVIGWGAVLILLIGPLDYLLVNFVLQKPQMTWFSLSLIVVGMTWWMYQTSVAANAIEQQAQLMELIDIDLSMDKIKGRAWYNFYSDATEQYSIRPQVQDLLSTGDVEASGVQYLQTSWVGRPETSYRGMYRSGGFESRKPAYHLNSNHNEVSDLPVRVYSTGLIGTEWEMPLEKNSLEKNSLVQFDLLDPGNGRLSGQLTYHGQQELTDWFVAYGNFAYFPRTPRGETQQPLRTGDQFVIDQARSNLLRGVLIGLTHTSIFSDGEVRGSANVNREIYDPLSQAAFPILKTLSFHEVTGGTDYTTLSNQSLRSADLSHLLSLDRAVLFGRIKSPLTKFEVNEELIEVSSQESVLRFIMPVDVDQIDVNAPPDPSLLKLK